MDKQAAASPSGLDGSAWTMSVPAGIAPNAKTAATLRFEAGRVSGSDGCNRFSAPYTTSPGKLQFDGPRAGTLMACPSEDGAQMARVIDEALTATRGYRIEAGKLLLLNASGTTLMGFDAQATGLAGSAWRVSGYNNGKQAVVSVIAGTALTLAFSNDDKLSGSGGCNHFGGSYRADGDTLTIGPLAATRKACAEPEGVMAQEAAFLRALETAATARREGDRLELRTATGALAATMRLEGDKP